MGHM